MQAPATLDFGHLPLFRAAYAPSDDVIAEQFLADAPRCQPPGRFCRRL